jgi:hypothetical protein
MTAPLCKRGHERTPENTISQGRCRLCRNERQRAYAQRRREHAATYLTRAEQIAAIRLETNTRGRDNYIARRQARIAARQAREARTAA